MTPTIVTKNDKNFMVIGFSEETITRLKNLGHSLVSTERIGNAQGVIIDTKTGLLETGPDPRKSSVAIGY